MIFMIQFRTSRIGESSPPPTVHRPTRAKRPKANLVVWAWLKHELTRKGKYPLNDGASMDIVMYSIITLNESKKTTRPNTRTLSPTNILSMWNWPSWDIFSMFNPTLRGRGRVWERERESESFWELSNVAKGGPSQLAAEAPFRLSG